MTDAVQLRMNARAQKLDAPDTFWAFWDQERLNKIYNGYGPDRWPECVRDAMTWVYRHYEETALIHDFEYHFSDGSVAGWLSADSRFLKNIRKQRDLRYPRYKFWLIPARLLDDAKIAAAAWALELGGYTAYNDAFNRRKEHE